MGMVEVLGGAKRMMMFESWTLEKGEDGFVFVRTKRVEKTLFGYSPRQTP